MDTAIFVSFEGGEGAGKSTQAKILHNRLRNALVPVILVEEPGTTSLGVYLREYLKSERSLSEEAELLLFVAARAELVSEQIKPALDAGITVIADRFDASSVAYQGYGRGLNFGGIYYLNTFATKGTTPDLTFLLDIRPADGLNRINSQGQRFENDPLSFHEKVRNGFLDLAFADVDRWVLIDGMLPIEAVSDLVWKHFMYKTSLLTQYGPVYDLKCMGCGAIVKTGTKGQRYCSCGDALVSADYMNYERGGISHQSMGKYPDGY